MPFSPVTLHGRPLGDGGRGRGCFSRCGGRGICCGSEVRRGRRTSVELLGGFCVILLLLPDLEYVPNGELSAQLA